MFSRVQTLIYLLLANIILLANITIPHHHHENEICIVDSHCQKDSETHEHKSDGHKHDHDSSTTDCCILNQIYIVPYNQVINTLNNQVKLNHLSQFDGFNTISADYRLSFRLPTKLLNRKLLLLNSYSCIVSTSNSLRAPPVV